MLACNTAPEAGEHVLLLDEPEQARRSPVESPIAGISERALQTRLLARCKQPNIAQDAFELVRLRHGRAAQGLRRRLRRSRRSAARTRSAPSHRQPLLA